MIRHILCSRAAAVALAPLLTRANGLHDDYRLVHPDADGRPVHAEIALVTRDITGVSTKHDVAPATEVFYEALRVAHGLQWVHAHSAGLDRPIFQTLKARGIDVYGSPGHNAAAVAQTALAGLLALARRLPWLHAAQRQARWVAQVDQPMPRDLQGQTATLVGWGAIAQHMAQVLHVLGMHIQVARHDGTQAAQGASRTVSYAALAELLPTSDWLILACPLSVHTQDLVNEQAIAALPPQAHIVNVARGEVVDEAAMVHALRQGLLAGAYLDVFAHEPLSGDSPLWQMENVILTPHCAGRSDGNGRRVLEMFLSNLRRYEQASATTAGSHAARD